MIDADNVFERFPDKQPFLALKKQPARFIGPITLTEPEDIVTSNGVSRVEPGRIYIGFDIDGTPYPITALDFLNTYEVIHE